MIDLIDLVKNKRVVEIDFSIADPNNNDVRRVLNFIYQSLPDEHKNQYITSLRDAIVNKKTLKFDFGQLPVPPYFDTAVKKPLLGSSIGYQVTDILGFPEIKTTQEVEQRLQEIERIRRQRALKPQEIEEKEKLLAYKKNVIPLIETGGVWAVDKILKDYKQKLENITQQRLVSYEQQYKETLRQIEQVRKELERTPPLDLARSVPLANELQRLRQKAVSLKGLVNNYSSFLAELRDEQKWYKSLFEGIYDSLIRNYNLVPVFRYSFSTEDKNRLSMIQKKLQAGQKLTDEEQLFLEEAETRMLRASSPGYSIGYAIAGMPAWGAEIALLKMLGGLLGITPFVARLFHGVPNQVAKKLLEFTTLGAIYSAVNVPQLVDTLYDYMLDQKIIVPQGDRLVEVLNRRGDNFWTALAKAFGSNTVEITSEFMGTFITNWRRFMPKWVLSKWVTKRGFKKVADVMNAIKKGIGWHGIIGEVFEEELARLGHAIVDKEPYKVPLLTEEGTKALLEEFVTIGLYGGILNLPNLPNKLKEYTNKVKEYRQSVAPKIITERDIEYFRKKYAKQVSKTEVTPEVEQVIQETKPFVTPPPKEPIVTTPPVTLRNNLFDKVSTIPDLEKTYAKMYEDLQTKIKSVNAKYDEMIKDLTTDMEQNAKLINADPQVLKEQIEREIETINKKRQIDLDLLEKRRLSLIASYNKRLAELKELDKVKEPPPQAIVKWQNIFPIAPLELVKVNVNELIKTSKQAEEIIQRELPTMNVIDKLKTITSLATLELKNLPFEQIKLKEEVQKTLRPYLQYNYELVNSIAKFFDPVFFDFLKVAYLQDTQEYVLFDGHHRYLALSKLQEQGRLNEIFPEGIPVVVVTFKNLKDLIARASVLRFINESRHGLNLVELAQAFDERIKQGRTVKEVAEELGRPEIQVDKILLINKLSPKWKEYGTQTWERVQEPKERLKIERLLLTMAELVDKYKIDEAVQTDILENWVKKENISPTTLKDWVTTLYETINSSFTKEERERTLNLFTGEEFKQKRSMFTDTLKQIEKEHKEYKRLKRNYERVLKDIETKRAEGVTVDDKTLAFINNRIQEIEGRIKNLLNLLVETYKGRPLTEEEKKLIKIREDIKKYEPKPEELFAELDEVATDEDRQLIFPFKYKKTTAGFKIIDVKNYVIGLELGEIDYFDEKRVVIKNSIVGVPTAEYDYYVVLHPESDDFYGIKKLDTTQPDNYLQTVDLLTRFLNLQHTLSPDETNDVKIVYTKLKDGKVYVNTRFINGLPVSTADKERIEKILRFYFKPHVPITFGITEKSEQLKLFEEQIEYPTEHLKQIREVVTFENLLYLMPGGAIFLKKSVPLSIDNFKKLLDLSGITELTPGREVSCMLYIKDNNIIAIEILPGYQGAHEFAPLMFPIMVHRTQADKIIFAHRHPTFFLDFIARYLFTYPREFYRLQKTFERENVPIEVVVKFDNILNKVRDKFQLLKITEGYNIYYEEIAKLLKENLTRQELEYLYDVYFKDWSILSEGDKKLISELKKRYPKKFQAVTYIFNDEIIEINLDTNEIKRRPYEKDKIFNYERIKDYFDLLPYYELSFYEKLQIPFKMQVIPALLEHLSPRVAMFLVKNNYIKGMISSLTGRSYLNYIDHDSIYAFARDTTTVELLEKFFRGYGKPVYIYLYDGKKIISKGVVSEEITPYEEPKKNRVYQNILRIYGKYFSEEQMNNWFMQRFGYNLKLVDKEDGLEFRRFLDRILHLPLEERGKVIDKWLAKEVDFAKVSRKLKSVIRRASREDLIKQLKLFQSRNPDMFNKVLNTIFEGRVTDVRQLDNSVLKDLVYLMAYMETDENLRKTFEYLSADELKLTFAEKLKFLMSNLAIPDAVFMRLGEKYPAVREIRDRVMKYLIYKDITLRGRLYHQLDEIRNTLGDKFVKEKFDLFVDYIETQQMPEGLTEQEKEKVLQAYKLYKDMMDWIIMQAQDAGILVYDPVRGMFSTIEPRENYFPHIYPEDYFDNIENRQKTIDHLVNTYNLTKEEASVIIDMVREDLKSKIVGNIELHRYYNIPGYKKSFDALLEYVRKVSDRISWVKHFGNDIFITPGRGYMPAEIYKLLSQVPNREVRRYILDVFKNVLYRHYYDYEVTNTLLTIARKFQTLKLPLASIDNMFQWFVNFSPRVKYSDMIKAIEKYLITLGMHTDLLNYYGLGEQLARALHHYFGEEKSDIIDRVASFYLNLGFLQTERTNRIMILFLVPGYVDNLNKLLQQGKKDKVVYELERLGVTKELQDKILKQGKITPEDQLEILYIANAMTNHLVDFWFAPLVMSKSELGRTMLQFTGTFMFPQTRMVARLYFKPFIDYVRSGGKTGDVKMFAKFLLHVAIATALARGLRDLLGRRKILMTKDNWERVINFAFFVMLTGWFGLFTIPADLLVYGVENLKDRFLGVGIQSLIEIINAIYSLDVIRIFKNMSPLHDYVLRFMEKKYVYSPVPTYRIMYNMLRQTERTLRRLQQEFGSDHKFTQDYYTRIYLPLYTKFVKRYGSIHVKLTGRLPQRATLTPTRREIVSRTPNL